MKETVDAEAVLLVNAHYPSITRGLTADIMAAQALELPFHTVCTSHVVASHGQVTDVLNVPSDTVRAQLEHIAQADLPLSAAKVGILGDAPGVAAVFDFLHERPGPFVLDLTLSGPSGEDLIDQHGIDALHERLSEPDVVALRLQDAELLAGMEIPSLDDAQVAIQRIAHNGARRVLLRCGRITTHYYDLEAPPPDFSVDLYYDGEEIALFEAPYVEAEDVHGAASGLLLALIKHQLAGRTHHDAMQEAKAFITEALRHAELRKTPSFLWKQQLEEKPS